MTNNIKELENKLAELKKQKEDEIKKKQLRTDIKKLENENKPTHKVTKLAKKLWDEI